eukprot:CAMPEP_0198702904 /NCGR_PEP_ID=MMETSP1468-20131203/389024_1 /TAXON_ID=1461545 /ORGANISM="Mantoniella sp, Strain CCMP1436" /LENGTH=187 /DNA_ID=CAMNT_0044461515 /DNA_START=82 /DNA_END=645 /DNA_ORIENTATION=-
MSLFSPPCGSGWTTGGGDGGGDGGGLFFLAVHAHAGSMVLLHGHSPIVPSYIVFATLPSVLCNVKPTADLLCSAVGPSIDQRYFSISVTLQLTLSLDPARASQVWPSSINIRSASIAHAGTSVWVQASKLVRRTSSASSAASLPVGMHSSQQPVPTLGVPHTPHPMGVSHHGTDQSMSEHPTNFAPL